MTPRPEDPNLCPRPSLVFAAAARGAPIGQDMAPVLKPLPESDSGGESVRQLGGLFADEPELILAFLEAPQEGKAAGADTVLAAAQHAIKSKPDYADLHCYTAQAALRAGKPKEALVLLERALDLNPRYSDALILAARASIALQVPKRAITYLRQALLLGADYPDVHLMLGDLWRARGENTRARKAYERALHLNKNLGPAREALAQLAFHQDTGGRPT